jgi:hypothetical protein
MTSRRRESTGSADLFEDTFFDLANPHAGQSVDLPNLLQSVRAFLGRDHDTVVSFRMRNPVLAALPLAVYARFSLDGEARCAIENFGGVSLENF